MIDTLTRKVMFRQHELDDKGELPAPFSFERYNFNVLDVRGDLERDRNGEFTFFTNKKNQPVDKQGRLVNEHGLLIDE